MNSGLEKTKDKYIYIYIYVNPQSVFFRFLFLIRDVALAHTQYTHYTHKKRRKEKS